MSDMTRERAKELFEDNFTVINTHGHYTKEEEGQAQELAISALTEELSEDGTLTVHVSDGSKVGRVLVMGDNIFGGLYYPDSAKTDTAKPESDLISRTQAINDYAQCFADEYGMDCGEMFIGVLHQCPTFPDSAENKGEWIPIEEREPEVHKYVMFTTKTTRREIGYKAKEEPYYFLFGDSGAYVKSDYILAWMELPEPYKGE